MQLIQHAVYRLPDGTRAVYRRWDSQSDRGRLHSDDEQSTPLYRVTGDGALLRYVYNAAEDSYQPTPCDLTMSDLTFIGRGE